MHCHLHLPKGAFPQTLAKHVVAKPGALRMRILRFLIIFISTLGSASSSGFGTTFVAALGSCGLMVILI